MPKKLFIIWLSGSDWLVVYMDTVKNDVISYVVKYLTNIDGKEYEIARFDSGHEYTHMDILLPDGSKERVVRFPNIDDSDVVDFAINNFKLNYDVYKARFEKWLKEK